jgi:uncharacterized protein (DUF983 family)
VPPPTADNAPSRGTGETDAFPPVPPLTAALACRCPRCGAGKLYSGLLEVARNCPACGLDLARLDVGDGPVAFVVLILGAVVVGLAILVEVLFAPPAWVHIVLWVPVVIGGSIWLLRLLKAWLIAQHHRHQAFEARIAP